MPISAYGTYDYAVRERVFSEHASLELARFDMVSGYLTFHFIMIVNDPKTYISRRITFIKQYA